MKKHRTKIILSILFALAVFLAFKRFNEQAVLKYIEENNGRISGGSYDWLPDSLQSMGNKVFGPKVYGVTFRASKIDDLDALSEVKSIVKLSLQNTQVSNIGFVKDLPNLEILVLNDQITSIESLKGKKSLKYLYLNGAPITDFRPLETLTNIHTLDLSYTSIANLDFLKNMKDLQYLDLTGTKVNDAGILLKHAKLKELNISNTSLKDSSLLKNLKVKEIIQ